jgi:hypothetical protein
MYIETPTVISISPLDFAQFTNGGPDMDLVDITFMGQISESIADPQLQNFMAANVSNGSSTLYNDPRKGIIENPGSFVYRLDLTLDSEKLLGSEVEGLSVEIASQPFDLFVADDFENIDSLFNKASLVSKALKSKATAETLKVVIDYRADFDIANKKDLAEHSQEKSDSMQQTAFFTVSSNLAANKLPLPVITSTATSNKVSINNLTMESLINSTITSGIDPFANMDSIDSHLSVESKFSLGNNDVFDFEEDVVRIKSQNIMGETSLSAIRAANLSKVYESKGYTESSKEAQKLSDFLSDFDEPKGDVQLGLVGTVTTKKFRVLRDIEIPKRIIGTDAVFYVRMKPIVKSQNSTDCLVEPASLDFTVKHQPQVFDILIPVVPPTVYASEILPGQVTLKIVSNDPTNKDMAVVRKIYDPRVKKFTHSKSLYTTEGLILDHDLPNFSPNKVYYTVSMVSSTGMVGPSISLVVDGLTNINTTSKEGDQNIKLYAINEESGIRVQVENIPVDVKTVRIIREHSSKIGDYKSKLTAIGLANARNIETSKSRSISVLDGTVTDGHRYRYYVIAKEARGLGYQSEDDDIIQRRYPRKALPYDVYCGNPTVQQTDPKMVIGIELSVAHKQESYEFFLKLMKNSGADKRFLGEVKKNRKYLSDVIAFNIDRVDTTTGKKINLGLRGPGVFLDGAGSAANPRGVQPGRKYVYIIRVCIKPVQSFFSGLFSALTNPNQTSGTKKTTFMTKKFLDTADRYLGALPSDSDIREDESPKDGLVAADTGLTFTKVLKTPKLRASVEDFSRMPSPFSRDHSIRLTFRLKGGPKEEVLKALVYCKSKLGRKCIGQIAIDSRADVYYFTDKVNYRGIGTKTYTIKLVYTDLKTSAHSSEIVAKRDNSLLPAFAASKLLELKY